MDKGSLSLLGPSVHTYGVIRPNYERKVRFPFMLLNKSWAAWPSISQHQQGAGDLQIKRSYYLCPPHHHHHHLDCCPPQHRCTRGAERVFLMIWEHQSFVVRGCGPVHIPLLAFFCTRIMSCPLSNLPISK